ncbi:MAG: cyclic nucleotide-binding domain-containing protein [Nannocystaceae bacterium]
MGAGLEELGIHDDAEDSIVEPRKADAVAHVPPQNDQTQRLDVLKRMLRQVTLFDGLLPVHLERIANLVQEIHYRPGDAVFKHGDAGDGLYLILTGAVRISRRVSGVGEEALAILKPGMYFGEMSIVDDDVPRSADAIAHEESRLLRLPKDDLRDLMFVDRELAYELLWRFVRTLSGRLRDSNDRLLMLTVSSKF